MNFEHILVNRDGRLTTITINRPASHNALNAKAYQEMEVAFDAFAADPEQWIAIVTGAGEKAFSAGHDLKQQASGRAFVMPHTGFGGLTARFDLTKPVIAAVNGLAMGGGFELALACDLVIAVETASFALPEPKVGLAALAGGMQRLPAQIGLKRAMGMLLTGRRVSAREGFDLGFVNQVVAGDLLGAARRWAQDILDCSPLAVRATKDAALRSLAKPIADTMKAQWDYPSIREMLKSNDAIEGPAAFTEKRRPVWTGR
ncbi:enoyl-CoA hydratase-related protein [Roseiarcus sp.]|uniref:enoyl-CoA hydratase-related protein n=1 Tax=Roseiarcus sp. TaxID=1969460 RepID=UPI003F9B7671